MDRSKDSREFGRESTEPLELTRLQLHVEIGEEVLRGERVFGDVVEDLPRELEEALAAGIDIGDLETRAHIVIGAAEQATIGNCQAMAARCFAKGDAQNGELWRAEADKRLTAFRAKRRKKYEDDIIKRERAGDPEGAARLRKQLEDTVAGWNAKS